MNVNYYFLTTIFVLIHLSRCPEDAQTGLHVRDEFRHFNSDVRKTSLWDPISPSEKWVRHHQPCPPPGLCWEGGVSAELVLRGLVTPSRSVPLPCPSFLPRQALRQAVCICVHARVQPHALAHTRRQPWASRFCAGTPAPQGPATCPAEAGHWLPLGSQRLERLASGTCRGRRADATTSTPAGTAC